MGEMHVGEFEELVLLAVGGLGDDAYAVSVQQRIEERTGRAASMGAVYTALDRLEEKGAVTSQLGDVTHERGGRRKRYYRITGAGKEILRELRRARERLWEDVDFKPSLGLR